MSSSPVLDGRRDHGLASPGRHGAPGSPGSFRRPVLSEQAGRRGPVIRNRGTRGAEVRARGSNLESPEPVAATSSNASSSFVARATDAPSTSSPSVTPVRSLGLSHGRSTVQLTRVDLAEVSSVYVWGTSNNKAAAASSGGRPACAICCGAFGPNDIVRTLSCHPSHTFHNTCAEHWMYRQGGARCPICRNSLVQQSSSLAISSSASSLGETVLIGISNSNPRLATTNTMGSSNSSGHPDMPTSVNVGQGSADNMNRVPSPSSDARAILQMTANDVQEKLQEFLSICGGIEALEESAFCQWLLDERPECSTVAAVTAKRIESAVQDLAESVVAQERHEVTPEIKDPPRCAAATASTTDSTPRWTPARTPRGTPTATMQPQRLPPLQRNRSLPRGGYPSGTYSNAVAQQASSPVTVIPPSSARTSRSSTPMGSPRPLFRGFCNDQTLGCNARSTGTHQPSINTKYGPPAGGTRRRVSMPPK